MITINLSEAPKDRLNRAFNYLAEAIAKQPKTDFIDSNSKNTGLKAVNTESSSG